MLLKQQFRESGILGRIVLLRFGLSSAEFNKDNYAVLSRDSVTEFLLRCVYFVFREFVFHEVLHLYHQLVLTGLATIAGEWNAHVEIIALNALSQTEVVIFVH